MSVGTRAWAGLTCLAFLAGCQLVLDFSSGIEEPVPDASSPPDAAPLPDAVSLCTVLEPNEAIDAATPIEPGVLQAAVCPGADEDFYSLTLDGRQDLNILLTFEAGANDLELELYSEASGISLTLSTGTDGDEQIAHTAAGSNRLVAGTYIIRVFGRDGAVQNDYTLAWEPGELPDP